MGIPVGEFIKREGVMSYPPDMIPGGWAALHFLLRVKAIR